jgi:hypothetical protein
MKYKTSVIWCAVSDQVFISVSEVAEYEFDYNATLDALNLMHNLRVSIAGSAGPGWSMLYRAAQRLEDECANYLRGK